MDYKKIKKIWKKVWHFIWEDDSLLSWIVNIILAFVLIKYLIYPGLGLLLGTPYPVVAVMSSSMEHNGDFDSWFSSPADCGRRCTQKEFYLQYNITKEEFMKFPFKNGFNKGDIMVLIKPTNIKIGDVVVFWSARKYPIIHRVIAEKDGIYQTKGDHNTQSIQNIHLNEFNVKKEQLVGKAVFRIPLLGYIKIAFVEVIDFFKGMII